MNIRRGDIYYADLSPVVGSEQGGIRPVLIVQNNVGNRFSPTVIAAAITRSVLMHNSALHTDNAIKENKQTTKRSVQLEKNSKPTDRCLLCYFTSMLHYKRICSTKVNLLF